MAIRLWLNASIVGLFSFLVIVIYSVMRRGFNGLDTINSGLAWTAVLLIGLSLLLSGICFFWDRWDRKIIYRKHLGVLGFILALIHAVISLPEVEEISATFVFAIVALTIFFLMTLISNKYAVHEIGGVVWRRLLRLGGYVGYILVILHFTLRDYPRWIKWLDEGMPFPPSTSVILFVFALFVLYFRIVLEIAIRRNKKPPVVQSSYEAPQQQKPPNSAV